MHGFPVQISGSIVIRVNFVAITSKVYAPPKRDFLHEPPLTVAVTRAPTA
jgi:hypothetical protein